MVTKSRTALTLRRGWCWGKTFGSCINIRQIFTFEVLEALLQLFDELGIKN